jgi:hypothetical protein
MHPPMHVSMYVSIHVSHVGKVICFGDTPKPRHPSSQHPENGHQRELARPPRSAAPAPVFSKWRWAHELGATLGGLQSRTGVQVVSGRKCPRTWGVNRGKRKKNSRTWGGSWGAPVMDWSPPGCSGHKCGFALAGLLGPWLRFRGHGTCHRTCYGLHGWTLYNRNVSRAVAAPGREGTLASGMIIRFFSL